MAAALVDFEPCPAFVFEARLQPCPDADAEPRAYCVRHFEAGIRAGLAEAFDGELPPVRVVLRWILTHPVDSNHTRNAWAGRMAVAAALRRATDREQE